MSFMKIVYFAMFYKIHVGPIYIKLW